MIGDARCWANNEPGCLSFAVIQDANNPNRIWLCEVYKDVAAFQGHTQAPHFIKWRDAVVHWRDETSLKGEEMAVPSSPGEKLRACPELAEGMMGEICEGRSAT